MMWLSRPTSSGSGGHLSGGELTGSSAWPAAGADRRAGPDVDAGVGDAGGDRAGRPAGRDRPVGRGDRADQAAPPRPHRRAAAGRDRRRAAGRGGLPGRAGPPARRRSPASSWPRCPGLAATTAAGLARRLSAAQWAAVETGLGDVHAAALAALAAVAPARAAALCESVTIDLDTTDVEVYGRHKRGVAYNHQGQRVGRPHVATWADTATVLAADLLAGNEDPRRDAAGAAASGAGRAARPRRGPGGSGCAPTPATSPGSWPAPPCSPTSSSPSARGGSRRCGGCSTGSPRRTGPTRSTCPAPRSPSPTTARTGGRPRPGC